MFRLGSIVGLCLLGLVALPLGPMPLRPAAADVVVIANRSKRDVAFIVMPPAARAEQYKLVPGDLVAVPTAGKVHVGFADGNRRKSYQLGANSAYMFRDVDEGRLDLKQIALGDDEHTVEGTRVVGSSPLHGIGKISVKILVDDDERAARRAWEERLRTRLDRVSDLLEKYCRVRLEVVAVEQWDSDNRINDFNKSLAEFESEVVPAPGQIAIGFTSQYRKPPKGQTHLGGTRGPFYTHVLIREWSQIISEAERMEVLLHELGHVLGAAHSAERDSVMRPLLGDRKARDASFLLKFDPANTLAMNLVVEEMRVRKVHSFADLSSGTRYRLKQIYTAMDASLPTDEAAAAYHQMLQKASLASLSLGAREVVRAVVRAAAANARLPEKAGDDGRAVRLVGDALTDHYVRQAAWAAKALPPDDAPATFLLALGIVLDNSQMMQTHPQLHGFYQQIEKPEERAARLAVLGEPTVHGRHDLAQHFIVSAYLAMLMGPKATEAAGVAKEMLDAHRKSGFSFADLAADKAGIRFGQGIIDRKLSLLHLANEFRVAYYVPAIQGLPEGLTWDQFTSQFGSFADDRYTQVIRDITARLDALPPYRAKLTTPRQIEP